MKPYLDYIKEKNIPECMEDYAGDVWTWAAIDRDTKLIKSWFAGGREADSANVFMQDVASRITNNTITTDAHHAYLDAADNVFHLNIDYAQLTKLYVCQPDIATQKENIAPLRVITLRRKFLWMNQTKSLFLLLTLSAKILL